MGEHFVVTEPFLFSKRQDLWGDVMDQKFFSIRQAADVLLISKVTVWRKIQEGEIPSARIGRRVLIPAEFFEKLKNKALKTQNDA